MIPRSKITVLKMAQREIGMDDDDYRDMLYGITGGRCTSSTDKTFHPNDFLAAMKIMEALGYNSDLNMTKSQFSTIIKLYKKLGWTRQPKRLLGFSKRVIGFEQWRKATPKQASNLIQAMIKLLEHENEKANV